MSEQDRYQIPPTKFSGKNMSDYAALFEVESYGVGQWTPEPDGKGTPEALILHFDLGRQLQGVTFAIRLKSKAEVNRLIEILQLHRDEVWP